VRQISFKMTVSEIGHKASILCPSRAHFCAYRINDHMLDSMFMSSSQEPVAFFIAFEARRADPTARQPLEWPVWRV